MSTVRCRTGLSSRITRRARGSFLDHALSHDGNKNRVHKCERVGAVVQRFRCRVLAYCCCSYGKVGLGGTKQSTCLYSPNEIFFRQQKQTHEGNRTFAAGPKCCIQHIVCASKDTCIRGEVRTRNWSARYLLRSHEMRPTIPEHIVKSYKTHS